MRTTSSNVEVGTAGRRDLPIRSRWSTIALATLLGSIPGLFLVLIAQFVIDGEMQLTVGAPGLVLAPAGALVGFIAGVTRSRRSLDGG